MKRLLIVVAVLAGLLVTAGAGVLLYRVATGPRMYHQENIRPFEALMPQAPPDSVPVAGADAPPEAGSEAYSQSNPPVATPENIARGKTYYGYYCRVCHGDDGRGGTDVGYGYRPPPAPLDSQRLRGMSDGQLVTAMLSGTGHQPVMARIVLRESYWYIPLFVRTLGRHPEP